MTQINYEEEHRKLWNWLADHPGARKADYFADWRDGDKPYNLCFACEVAAREADRTGAYSACTCCPLGGELIMGCRDGLYAEWATAAFRKRRRKLALQIANLSWKGAENNG